MKHWLLYFCDWVWGRECWRAVARFKDTRADYYSSWTMREVAFVLARESFTTTRGHVEYKHQPFTPLVKSITEEHLPDWCTCKANHECEGHRG